MKNAQTLTGNMKMYFSVPEAAARLSLKRVDNLQQCSVRQASVTTLLMTVALSFPLRCKLVILGVDALLKRANTDYGHAVNIYGHQNVGIKGLNSAAIAF